MIAERFPLRYVYLTRKLKGDLMRYIRDVGMREVKTSSGVKRFRFALFECDRCGSIVERKKGDGLKQKKCCGGKSAIAPKGSDLHNRYVGMIQRCMAKDMGNKYYGGRGVKVCKEWLNFDNFARWALENGFKKNMQIDRIDVNGDYCPENCRFVTASENARNKRNNIHNDEQIKKIKMLYVTTPISQKELADKFGDSEGNISNILNGASWMIETEWDEFISSVSKAKMQLPSKIRKIWMSCFTDKIYGAKR